MIDEIFDDPEKWVRTFEERRRAFEDLVEKQRARRKSLEDELGAELQKTAEGYAQVAPIAPAEIEGIPRRRAAYSDRMAALMAKLSLLAYVRFEEPSKRQILEKAVERAGLKLVSCIAVNDVEAFVVEHDYFMVVAYRGTTSEKDRKLDFSLGIEKVEIEGFAQKVRVHAGFFGAFLTTRDQVREALTRQSGDKPNNKAIYLTGHSLGGAIALVASAEFSGSDRLGDRIAAVYTFGAPRVGESNFGLNVKAPHYRIVNEGDIVPLVPPNWGRYRHSVPPRLLRKNADRIAERRSDGWLIPLLVWSVLRWLFVGRKMVCLSAHDISAYVSRLQHIAQFRGKWT